VGSTLEARVQTKDAKIDNIFLMLINRSDVSTIEAKEDYDCFFEFCCKDRFVPSAASLPSKVNFLS
jgi:hypothetical protein